MSVFQRNIVSLDPKELINKYPFTSTELIPNDLKDVKVVFESLVNSENIDDRISIIQHQPLSSRVSLFGLAFFTDGGRESDWLEYLKTIPSVLSIAVFKRTDGEHITLLVLDNLGQEDSITEKFISVNKVYDSHSKIYNLLFTNSSDSKGASISIVNIKYYVFKEKIVWWLAIRHQNQIKDFPSYFRPVRFASFLGHIQFEFHKGFSELAGKELGFPVEFVPINLINETRSLYGENLTVLDSVKEFNIDFAFICGITYATFSSSFIPLVAPVRAGKKYQGQAVYFSEAIVRDDQKDIHSLDDLRGAIFGYNETTSYSGYVMAKNHIKEKYNTSLEGFFKENIATVSHANSIQQVLKGNITCAAIDSTVLEMEIIQKGIKNLKVVESIGPESVGPLAATKSVSPELYQRVSAFFASLSATHPLFVENGFLKFLAVDENHYKQIKQKL
eukprot:TRINITY_DN5933_c0_g2_i4.p1 TRINITY_DN5933_c0_g2~~TRINITY_DN5933_c0_g2_i4.p1  ORF type:complete len:446 (-),score=67.85 TRINITY_DN5933_c0_g2_i4:156-1493(-)